MNAHQQFFVTLRWLRGLNIAQMVVQTLLVFWCYQLAPEHVPGFMVALSPWVFGNVITVLASVFWKTSSLLLATFALTQVNGPIFLIMMMGNTIGTLGWIVPVLFLAMSCTWGMFLGVLYLHVRAATDPQVRYDDEDLTWSDVIQMRKSSSDQTLAELSAGQKLFVLLLRHQGCTFCREALDDLRESRRELEGSGYNLCVVHMSNKTAGGELMSRHGLADVPNISDPRCEIYRALQLQRGKYWQLMAPQILWRGFKVAILGGAGFGRIVGDAFQMGGAFVLENGEIVEEFRQRLASDRPDYCDLARAQRS